MSVKCYTRFAEPGRQLTFPQYLELADKLRSHRKELVLFCDHPPVITSGLQSNLDDLRVPTEEISAQGVEIIKTLRGGGYTAHEPGQCVIYPHLDLKKRGIRISHYVKGIIDITRRSVEETWGIPTLYRDEAPGLYTSNGGKLVSIGMEIRRDFTSLGAALNLSNDLRTFDYINPCGLKSTPMSSIVMVGGNLEKKGKFMIIWMKNLNQLVQHEFKG